MSVGSKPMKAMLLGSSFSAVPILNYLSEKKIDVTVVGDNREDACHRIARSSIFLDYSDTDLIEAEWSKGQYDFLIPSCNDAAYDTGVSLASKYKVPGYDKKIVATQISNKYQFRSLCIGLGIPAPSVLASFSSLEPPRDVVIKGKALIKPVDSFSGKGIVPVENYASAQKIAASKALSKSRQVIIEEFVSGELHSHTAFIKNQTIVWEEFVDEFCEVNEYQVSSSSFPSNLHEKVRNSISSDITKIARFLQLTDGLIHTQFISNKSDYWLIESMRRCPGDLYGHQFRLSQNFDYAGNYTAPFIEETFDLTARGSSLAVHRQVLSTNREIEFFGSRISNKFNNTLIIPVLSTGQYLNAAPNGKAGIIFSYQNSEAEVSPFGIIGSTKFI